MHAKQLAIDFDSLSMASQRAYLSDLADFVQWCTALGVDPRNGDVGARHMFAYLVGLVRAGRAPSTVRRRVTALRRLAAIAHHPPIKFGFDPTELAELERKVLTTDVGNASVLVISDDAVIRAGLHGVLTEAGAVCWAEPVCDLHRALITAWDYVLVWVQSHRGSDRLAAISRVAALSSEVTTEVPVIAVHGAALPAVTRLRLAEAGFRYLVPHSWLSQHLAGLARLLGRADIPQEFHLATPLALRQALGLQLSGELEPLISRAADLPDTVWMDQTRKASGPPRSAVNELRAMALRSSGLPPPDFAKYATSTRRAPALPEWPRVRELLRESLGYVDTMRPWSAQVAHADARI